MKSCGVNARASRPRPAIAAPCASGWAGAVSSAAAPRSARRRRRRPAPRGRGRTPRGAPALQAQVNIGATAAPPSTASTTNTTAIECSRLGIPPTFLQHFSNISPTFLQHFSKRPAARHTSPDQTGEEQKCVPHRERSGPASRRVAAAAGGSRAGRGPAALAPCPVALEPTDVVHLSATENIKANCCWCSGYMPVGQSHWSCYCGSEIVSSLS